LSFSHPAMPHLLTNLRRDNRGVAMVEMAMVLPVLLVVLLGIVDFARAFNYWNDTNQLAADGARFAAVDRNPGEGLPTPVSLQEFIRSQAETEELRSSSECASTSTMATRRTPTARSATRSRCGCSRRMR
jgi:Flp pilus assembly pilin Flp